MQQQMQQPNVALMFPRQGDDASQGGGVDRNQMQNLLNLLQEPEIQQPQYYVQQVPLQMQQNQGVQQMPMQPVAMMQRPVMMPSDPSNVMFQGMMIPQAAPICCEFQPVPYYSMVPLEEAPCHNFMPPSHLRTPSPGTPRRCRNEKDTPQALWPMPEKQKNISCQDLESQASRRKRSPSRNQLAAFNSMSAGLGDNGGSTMKAHLRALRMENPEAVIVTRRINKLGFESGNILRAHFSQYGEVKHVCVCHSHVKRPGKPLRFRPAGMGFVVMGSPEIVSDILTDGAEQVVAGVAVQIRALEQRNAPQTASPNDLNSMIKDFEETGNIVDGGTGGTFGARERWHSPDSDSDIANCKLWRGGHYREQVALPNDVLNQPLAMA
jgi:hypothetical protein